MAGRDNLQGETLRFAGEDRYLLERRIGEGGFGDVYQAMDLKLRKHRAIKTVDRSYASQIKREAIVGNQIESQHIVNYIDFESDSDPPYMVMEYLLGPDLHTLLQMGKVRGRLLLRLVEDVGDALQCLHERHVIHRDLKPRNIKLVDENQRNERFMILDFGIASQRDAGETMRGATFDGAGTLEYMAPEQFGNEDPTGQADTYAFGVILFQVLTGQVPMRYQHTNATSYLRDRAELDSPRFHDILQRELTAFEADVENIVLKSLDRDPGKRPELAQIVEEFQSAFDTTDARIGPPAGGSDSESATAAPTPGRPPAVIDNGPSPDVQTLVPGQPAGLDSRPPDTPAVRRDPPPAQPAAETASPLPADRTLLPAAGRPEATRLPGPAAAAPPGPDQTLTPSAPARPVERQPLTDLPGRDTTQHPGLQPSAAKDLEPQRPATAQPLNFDQTLAPGGLSGPEAAPGIGTGSDDWPVAPDSPPQPSPAADDAQGFTRLFPAAAKKKKPRHYAPLAISLVVTFLVVVAGGGYLLLNRQVEQLTQRISTAADADRYADALRALRDMHFSQKWLLDPAAEQRRLADQAIQRVEDLTADAEFRRALALCDELETHFKSIPAIGIGPRCDRQRAQVQSALLAQFDQRLERDELQSAMDFVAVENDLLLKLSSKLPQMLRQKVKQRGIEAAANAVDPAGSCKVLEQSLLPLFPDDAEVLEQLWRYELQDAVSLNAREMYADAVQRCLNAEGRGASGKQLLDPLCTAYFRQAASRNWPEAQAGYQQVLDRLDQHRDHPLWSQTLLHRAQSRLPTEPQQAVCDCATVLQQHPGHPEATKRLTDIAKQFRRTAIPQFRQTRAATTRPEQRLVPLRAATVGISAWELSGVTDPDRGPLELYFIRATLRWELPQPDTAGAVSDYQTAGQLASQRKLKTLAAVTRLRVAWIQATHTSFQNDRPDIPMVKSAEAEINDAYDDIALDEGVDQDLSWLSWMSPTDSEKPKDREYQLAIWLADSIRIQAAILGTREQFEKAKYTMQSALGQLTMQNELDKTSLGPLIEARRQAFEADEQRYKQNQAVVDSRKPAASSPACPNLVGRGPQPSGETPPDPAEM